MSLATESNVIPYPAIDLALIELGVPNEEREVMIPRIKREADRSWRESEFFRTELQHEGWREFFAGYAKATYRRLKAK